MNNLENKNRKKRPFLLIELLNSFSAKELEGFRHFVSCKYFNSDKYTVALIEILLKNVVGKKEFNVAEQRIAYQHTFPGKPSPKEELNQKEKSLLIVKMNVLTRLAELFLCHEGLLKNKACKTELLYKELLDRNQFWLFNRQVKKDKKVIENQEVKGLEHYAHELKVEFGILNYTDRAGLLGKQDNLKELNTSLDIHYLLNKLGLHITALLQNFFYVGKSPDLESINHLSNLLKQPVYADHPLIKIYQMTIKLLNTNDENTYTELLNLLDKYTSLISMEDLYDFYVLVLNFCTLQIRRGNLEYYQNCLELYQIMDSKNIFVRGDTISPQRLRNIIVLGCYLKDFDWASEILLKYRQKVKKTYQKSVYHFNLGLINFYKEKYKEAVKNFIRVDNFDLSYDTDCRIMLLQCHYELDEEYDERTMQIFRMAEKYIQKKQTLTLNMKKRYLNFIRPLMSLYRFRHGIGKMTLERIKEKLEKQDINKDKRWLLGKIEALEKNEHKKRPHQ